MSTDTETDELAKFVELAQELRDAVRRHPAMAIPASPVVTTGSTSSVQIGAGGVVALLVSVIAIVVLCIAGSIVFAVKAQRDADMRDIEAANREISALRSEIGRMREQVDIGSAYDQQYQRRLSALEAKVAK
jgi:hypothetical protein